MGCDIHCYAEVRKNGKWEKVGEVFENEYYNPDKPTKKDNDGYVWNAPKIDRPYNGRNYDLFAILANVRNGRGFAACDTSDGFNPISKPRGLPPDCSPEIKKITNDWGNDGHSHSHLLFKEILEYDFEQTTKHRGYLTPQEYQHLKKEGKPDSWCGGVSGGMVKHITPEQMDILLNSGVIEFWEKLSETDKENKTWGIIPNFYVQMDWPVIYKDAVGKWFFEKTIPQLKSLGDPEDVRIVFWFDN